MANDTLKINVPEVHPEFEDMDQVWAMYEPEVVVEIINRYISAQMMARKYRHQKAASDKAKLKAYNEAVEKGLITPGK
jgi:hypothetical protein